MMQDDKEQQSQMYATTYHAPVLASEVVDYLVQDPEGTYVDATLGGGGHSAALLDALAPAGRVLGVDRDAEAIATARERLADEVEAERFDTVRGNFADLPHLLRDHPWSREGVSGVLLDLGVSSHQIDAARRGFSFMQEGELDMRMDDRAGRTAEEVVNRWKEGHLRDILYQYGEERRSGGIARAIVGARPIHTTTELADVVRSAVPDRDEVKSLARVFQAIRIAVNGELEALEHVLGSMTEVLPVGGRVVVISYHSLEDRRVKRFLRYGNFEGEPHRDLYGNLIAPFEEVERKPIDATEEEVEANPRARSARMRVAERIVLSDSQPMP